MVCTINRIEAEIFKANFFVEFWSEQINFAESFWETVRCITKKKIVISFFGQKFISLFISFFISLFLFFYLCSKIVCSPKKFAGKIVRFINPYTKNYFGERIFARWEINGLNANTQFAYFSSELFIFTFAQQSDLSDGVEIS